jgi:hypothetical protein
VSNDNAGGLLANPLPIVMVVLLAAGVFVKNVPLQSARPTDPERVKFVPADMQDVEARLWQDPFAAVEKHDTRSDSRATHTHEALYARIKELHKKKHDVTVVAVSVFGGSFDEAAESRRRSRFAVMSALGFHGYSPENSDAVGYFHINLPDPDAVNLTVPYEWFEGSDQSSNVLVLWLNEDKLTTGPLQKLRTLFAQLTPAGSGGGFSVKLVGPSGSGMLMALVRDINKERDNNKKKVPQKFATSSMGTPMELEGASTLQIFAPGATVSNCDLIKSPPKPDSPQPWECFVKPPELPFPIVRTIGTDDVLATALLWELWQRGVNRKLGYVDPWWERIWATLKRPGDTSLPRECADGLVLVYEWDSEYARALQGNLTEGFRARCKVDNKESSPPVRWFTYLRGLDGVLPDSDKSKSNAPRKDDDQSKDLRAQLKDAPPEHAEGRSQFDYLRRLAGEIARLDGDKTFAKNGVKAIGIVGSDVYDKLLILQALRSRFEDKIFFTTDLDARYLHADQKDWARNLVVASNFGLSLRPKLQQSTLPFRDGYQTATYLATLMALKEFKPKLDPKKAFNYWTDKMKSGWLRPQIFEIGRTEAVHLASPSLQNLTEWNSKYTNGDAPRAVDDPCDAPDWAECSNIEPERPSRLRFDQLLAIISMLLLGILSLVLASRHVQKGLRVVKDELKSPRHAKARAAKYGVRSAGAFVIVLVAIIVVVYWRMGVSLDQGIGEPFMWLEGVSVWPSLVVRFVGLVTTLALTLACMILIRLRTNIISKRFKFRRSKKWTLGRSRWSAVSSGPHLDLTSFGPAGEANVKPADAAVEIATLWQNYLRATGWREMAGWILVSTLIVFLLAIVPFAVLGPPSFPHRGQLVETLYIILGILNGLVLWLVIFWVGYETHTCARFIEILSDKRSVWPERMLGREEAETGVPRAHLDDYLDFQLIVLATGRIHWLIYLPFVSILFLVLARSDLFDAMDFPLSLVFVTALALAYALCAAVLLRKSAEAARAKVLAHYEAQLLTQARPKDSTPPAAADVATAGPTRQPISAEQIKLLMERIRSTREGAFAPFTQQPALRALLLPFGGYGGVQLVEYLINLKV